MSLKSQYAPEPVVLQPALLEQWRRDYNSQRLSSGLGLLTPSEFTALARVDWFNNRRLPEPIGNIPPAEAEERYYYAMMEQSAMVA